MLTATLAVVLLTGAVGSGKTTFEEIDVQRLNLREPDGTLRYVLSNSARLPGAIIRGKEYEHPRPLAGMLFYNDEGTEVGGLGFSGSRDADGKVMSIVSMSFDRYEQDQIVQILANDRGGDQYAAGLVVNDRPDYSILSDLEEMQKIKSLPEEERNAALEEFDRNYTGGQRLFAGRGPDGTVALVLNDASKKPRIRIAVDADGEAAIEFLDDEGKVTGRLTPDSLPKAE
ncbi:hypothetical protein [Marilutibacter alkalisoli]|uniref:hypothetical protein n=1 Tax=Marilutibacter alkalisoli TaxID=2591633 RepID=UPI001FC9E06F|nr:hypothetical protein [Lysobacter alkalisoli]